MRQTQTQSIITMTVALISCLSAFYLWVALFLRKRDYRRTRRDANNYTSSPRKFKYFAATCSTKQRKFSYTTSSTITIYTQFVYYMAMYQTLLSLALMLASVNEYSDYKYISQSCSWTRSVSCVLCFASRSFVSFFVIGSISWYFVITATICSSLFHRVSISNMRRVHKCHLVVISISLFVAMMELGLAHHSGDYDFSEHTVGYGY